MATHIPEILTNLSNVLQPSTTDDGHGDNEAAKIARLGAQIGADRLLAIIRSAFAQLVVIPIGTMAESSTVTRRLPVVRGMKIHGAFYTATAATGTVTADVSENVAGTVTSLLSSTAITEATVNAAQQLPLVEGNQDLDAPTVEGTYDRFIDVTVVTASSSTVVNGSITLLMSWA